MRAEEIRSREFRARVENLENKGVGRESSSLLQAGRENSMDEGVEEAEGGCEREEVSGGEWGEDMDYDLEVCFNILLFYLIILISGHKYVTDLVGQGLKPSGFYHHGRHGENTEKITKTQSHRSLVQGTCPSYV